MISFQPISSIGEENNPFYWQRISLGLKPYMEIFLTFAPNLPHPVKYIPLSQRSNSTFFDFEDFRAKADGHTFFPGDDSFRAGIYRIIANKWNERSAVKCVEIGFLNYNNDRDFAYSIVAINIEGVEGTEGESWSGSLLLAVDTASARRSCGFVDLNFIGENFKDRCDFYYYGIMAAEGGYVVVETITPDVIHGSIHRFQCHLDRGDLTIGTIEEQGNKTFTVGGEYYSDINLCRERYATVDFGSQRRLFIRDFSRDKPQPEQILHQKLVEDLPLSLKLDNSDYLWLRKDDVIEVLSPDLEPYAQINLSNLLGASMDLYTIDDLKFFLPDCETKCSIVLCLRLAKKDERDTPLENKYYGLSRQQI